MGSTSRSDERSEIVFFDVETTVPTRTGQGFGLLEFGAILVCPRKLVELESYSTLIQPTDLSLISSLSVRCNGITRDAVVSAPTFSEIADRVYDILQGRSLSLSLSLLRSLLVAVWLLKKWRNRKENFDFKDSFFWLFSYNRFRFFLGGIFFLFYSSVYVKWRS